MSLPNVIPSYDCFLFLFSWSWLIVIIFSGDLCKCLITMSSKENLGVSAKSCSLLPSMRTETSLEVYWNSYGQQYFAGCMVRLTSVCGWRGGNMRISISFRRLLCLASKGLPLRWTILGWRSLRMAWLGARSYFWLSFIYNDYPKIYNQ
jgi:hypothetical protein